MTLPSIAMATLLITQAHAADINQCLDYREAKKLHKGAYLTWTYGERRKRCWGVKASRRIPEAKPIIIYSTFGKEVDMPLIWPPKGKW